MLSYCAKCPFLLEHVSYANILPFMQNCNEESFKDVNNKFMDNINNKTDVWKIVQINRPSQCQSLQLSGHGKADKVNIVNKK